MKTTSLARLAIVAVPIVVIAGCSSSSSNDAQSAKQLKRAASVTHESSPASTTTAPATSTAPPCSVAAASAVLAPDTADSIACGEGWAAGSAHNTHVDYAFLLHDVNGAWVSIDTDRNQAEMQQACADGNPLGIPQNVLAVSPCDVS